jgi:mycoredoxin
LGWQVRDSYGFGRLPPGLAAQPFTTPGGACHNAPMPKLPIPDVLTVYGADWCADCRRARRYLDATQVPYRWIDVAADAAARDVLAAAGYEAIPVLLLPTGQVLMEPSNDELANAVGTAA